ARARDHLPLQDVDRDDLWPDELVAGLETRAQPAGNGLVALGVVGGDGRHRALAAGVEVLTFVLERFNSLAIEGVLDCGANGFQGAAQSGRAVGLVGRLGLDHLADVVVKLDQVDEDRSLYFQKEVLFVVLELGGETCSCSTSRSSSTATGPTSRTRSWSEMNPRRGRSSCTRSAWERSRLARRSCALSAGSADRRRGSRPFRCKRVRRPLPHALRAWAGPG